VSGEVPAVVPLPAGFDAVVAELRGLRADFHLLAGRLEANEAATGKATGIATAAAAAAAQAYDQATAAMRQTSEIKLDVADVKAAMVRHAETVSAASQAMVAANDAQTPMLVQTLAVVTTIKKNWPAVAAGIVALATIIGQAVNAYLRARGKAP